MIDLLLVYLRSLLSFFGLERVYARPELAPVRKEISRARHVSLGALAPGESVWLGADHVLGRFGAPPGSYRNDCWQSAVASKQREQELDGSAVPQLLPQQNESV